MNISITFGILTSNLGFMEAGTPLNSQPANRNPIPLKGFKEIGVGSVKMPYLAGHLFHGPPFLFTLMQSIRIEQHGPQGFAGTLKVVVTH